MVSTLAIAAALCLGPEVCVCVCVCVCEKREREKEREREREREYVCIYLYTLHIHICVYIYVFIYIYAHIHLHTHTHAQLHTCIKGSQVELIIDKADGSGIFTVFLTRRVHFEPSPHSAVAVQLNARNPAHM